MENDDFCKELQKLLIQSEGRMDRTNEMVCKCVAVTEKLTQEYILQINKLQEARDKLLEENMALVKLLEKEQSQSNIINKKYDQLLERLLNFMPKANSSENNITIK